MSYTASVLAKILKAGHHRSANIIEGFAFAIVYNFSE